MTPIPVTGYSLWQDLLFCTLSESKILYFAVTVPNSMWSVSYKPVGKDQVITFGSGVNWD